MAKSAEEHVAPLGEAVIGAVVAAFIRLVGLLPFNVRIPVGAWVVAYIVAPLAGYRRRVRDNLRFARPDLEPAEVRRLMRRVPWNAARTMLEFFSPADVRRIAGRTPITGPGVADMEAARAAGRPIIFVSGHIGNYDIGRSALIQAGYRVGGLYRPMSNRAFNRIYVQAIAAVGEPLFERGRRGMADMIRHLKSGGSLAILIDQHMRDGAPLTFFGARAYTALSAAELALKYDALVVPIYAIRKDDGGFFIEAEAPVPHASPETMTQALNDSLEARVRQHMDQWLWIHRRWRQGS